MGRYLEDAKLLYEQALKELGQWEETRDPILLRDAAEKAWRAVTQASNELLDAYGRRVPSGTNSRRIELHALERSDGQLRTLRLRDRFSSAEGVLHNECFYDGVCSVPLINDTVVEDVKEYLDDVERMTADRSRR